ncbi:apolipoprotein N-acyltransferase [Dietzia psychralcaliphila]|uniref:Apolipoprotein N-acyltransferase n=1 Tax=Dietzia psychralcaliphila TaxID=139021 RepID=A0AAD0JTC2_9ACTN|nr:apolipoprotein N-acyltransferase [Dietzia psychralcaliphila]AWH95421.1 apolipoprotein N-acyltransferase [Dietzia psychralcaliphila]PTM84291.1 apolipoprotein N-acyltransferase [Dietzia psychralcaliphila]
MITTLARVVGAAAAGALLAASFPPVGLWWAALPAIALLVVVLSPLRGPAPRVRTGALLGLVAGLVFFLLLAPWVGLYVGAYAAWALALVEALYLAAFGAGAVPILRAGLAPGPRVGLRALGAVAGVAGWWSLWEWIRSSWPWGGFPWGRLAFGQADSPLLALASLGGAPLLGFAVASLGAVLGIGALILVRGDRPGRTAIALLAAPLVTAGLVAGASVAASAGDTRETVEVTVIQGNVPRLGLDFNAQRRAVLENHLRVTAELANDVEAGTAARPDLVLWPENASDISPLADQRAGAQITALSRRLDAPILVGTVLRVGDGPETTNSYLVWDGDDEVVGRHDKRYIQPFGEWLPLREPLEALFPIARTAGHFVPGDGTGLVTAAGVGLGVAICFEIAFDDAAREPVTRGAQILIVPTNNATFGRSPMTYQQLAMSRVRAVEHRVPVLIAATSGVSAVIGPDGRVRQETGIFEPAVLAAQVEVGGAGTMATRLGGIPQAVSCLTGLAGLAWALIRTRPRPATDFEEI